MSATSVTGIGLGIANSAYKPENNWRTFAPEEQSKITRRQSGCVINHRNCSIINSIYVNKSVNFKTCG